MLNHNLAGEGTWLRARNLAGQLAHEHDVKLVAVSPVRRFRPRSYTSDNVRIIETPFWGLKRFAASGLSVVDVLFRLFYILRADWDVLVCFSSLPNVALPFLIARSFFSNRCFVSDWDDLFSDGGIYERFNHGFTALFYRLEHVLEFAVRRRAGLVTVTSRYLEKKAREIGVRAPILYLPTGADTEKIKPLDKKTCRAELNWPSDRCVLYFLGGGFNPDVVLLLRAFAIAVKENRSLLLALTSDFCPEYRTEIQRLGLESDVLQTGRIPYNAVPTHLGAADILAMPLHDCVNSRARGPIKLRDYLCAGRPIVGTALGEVKEVLTRYRVGKLADIPPESFADAILELSRDAEFCEKAGAEARRVAEHEVSWKKMGDLFLDALKEIQ